MDQANHNILMAVVGWGILLPPCYCTAVLAYIWHTALSRNIVIIFNNEAREREARAFCSWLSKEKKQTFSLSQTSPAGVPSVPVPTGLSPHSHQLDLTRLLKKRRLVN